MLKLCTRFDLTEVSPDFSVLENTRDANDGDFFIVGVGLSKLRSSLVGSNGRSGRISKLENTLGWAGLDGIWLCALYSISSEISTVSSFSAVCIRKRKGHMQNADCKDIKEDRIYKQ